MSISFDYTRFFSKDADASELEALVADVISNKASLEVAFHDKLVRFTASLEGVENQKLSGSWISPVLNGAVRGGELPFAAALVAPLLFDIHGLSIPVQAISSFRLPYRAPADFLMRNVLAALAGSFPTDFSHSLRCDALPSSEIGKQVRIRYWWAMSTIIDTRGIVEQNPMDAIALNAHCFVSSLGEAMLDEGASEFRRLGNSGSHFERIRSARNRVLEAIK